MKAHQALVAAISCCALPLAFAPSTGQVMLGSPTVVDGDTFRFGNETVRLYGIDAPESEQTCTRGSETWACGQEATSALRQYVAGGRLDCKSRDFDVYGRIVAVCRANGRDLSQAMTERGFAVALPQTTTAYVAAEQAARTQRKGIWAGNFVQPADYRAAHPIKPDQVRTRSSGRTAARARAISPRVSTPSTSSTYYRSCREAWAVGAAPLYRGQPGYRIGLDGDLDGIACEPFRR